MDEDFKAQTVKAIKDLHAMNMQHLNRQLAFEGLMTAMLDRIQPEALAGLLEEYEQACDRLAAQLDPKWQMPHLWQQWSDAITERMQSLRTAPKTATPGDVLG
jgi:hypothetical protein